MPLYEFRCPSCDARFEALADAGTETHDCRSCGAAGAQRVVSLPADMPKLVRSAGGNRRQEARNRKLRESTKADFSERRERARGAANPNGGRG